MITGAQMLSERICRQTSKPSAPGSITSRITASTSWPRASGSASSPSLRDVDRHALVAQAAADGRCHPDVVLDHKHAHASIIPLNLRGG